MEDRAVPGATRVVAEVGVWVPVVSIAAPVVVQVAGLLVPELDVGCWG
jgi:hypothetical protein